MVNDGDWCSPDVGTNMIIFGLASDDTITAWISDPSSGQIVAYYTGSAPAGYVGLPWNFTESDGVTPYTNTSYVITFVASDPDSLTVTNQFSDGVRFAAGVVMTYAYDNTVNDPTAVAMNAEGDKFIAQNLAYVYNDIYDGWGLTQYTPNYGLPSDIGEDRNFTYGMVCPYGSSTTWRPWFQQALNSTFVSDLDFGPAHGSPGLAGAVGNNSVKISPSDMAAWTKAVGKNWRLRKIGMWACNTVVSNAPASPSDWPGNFGIYPTIIQHKYQCWKSAGLFFSGHLPMWWPIPYTGSLQSSAQAEDAFDEFWVEGPNAYPGGCDPTYGIQHAAGHVLQAFRALKDFGLVLTGYYDLPYSGSYDDQLLNGNTISIHQ